MSEAAAAQGWRAATPPYLLRARMVAMVEGVPLAGSVVGVWLLGDVVAFDVAILVVGYVLSMTGVELGMHRLIAHRQFTTTAPIRALLCVLGATAAEGSPLLWSAIHRVHHSDPDGPDDPHSPVRGRSGLVDRVRGFLWAQFLWYSEVPAILRFGRALRGQADEASQEARFVRLVRDWRDDPVVVAVDRLYPLWIVLGYVAPAAVGALVLDDAVVGALHGVVWGGFVRHLLVKQVSFAINSIGHTIGARSMQSGDESRNNVVMALLTLGSGWHNNHHAFPGSATLWFRWWQVDPCAIVIAVLERAGLASDVRRAPIDAIAARRVVDPQ